MVGFSYNEVSRRYVDDPPEFFYPTWRKGAENKKQGSAEAFDAEYQEMFSVRLRGFHSYCESEYNWYLSQGVAPEQARMVLPQSMYTSYYVTGSLAAWERAYKLRTDPHAQLEIQELAHQWHNIIQPLFPVSWAALTT
jgi:thymidylate synthase (FAD)